MYMVDADEQKPSSFGYINQDGDVEYVTISKGGNVDIIDPAGDVVMSIYPQDVPKMIKALKLIRKYHFDEKPI